jgi:hypothetical protein
MLVEHHRDVVGLVGVTDAAFVGPVLVDLLQAAVQVAHDRSAVDDLLSVQAKHQTQHAVRAGVLRPEIEDELLGDEALVRIEAFRRLELDVRLYLDRLPRALLDVGLQLRYPPFAIFSRSFRMPSTRASGRGGQPGT